MVSSQTPARRPGLPALGGAVGGAVVPSAGTVQVPESAGHPCPECALPARTRLVFLFGFPERGRLWVWFIRILAWDGGRFLSAQALRRRRSLWSRSHSRTVSFAMRGVQERDEQ